MDPPLLGNALELEGVGMFWLELTGRLVDEIVLEAFLEGGSVVHVLLGAPLWTFCG